jgi:hypothetical protein
VVSLWARVCLLSCNMPIYRLWLGLVMSLHLTMANVQSRGHCIDIPCTLWGVSVSSAWAAVAVKCQQCIRLWQCLGVRQNAPSKWPVVKQHPFSCDSSLLLCVTSAVVGPISPMRGELACVCQGRACVCCACLCMGAPPLGGRAAA